MRSEMEEAIIRYEEELECACDVEDFKAGWRAALHSVEAEKEPVAITTDHFDVVNPGHIEQTIRVMGDSGLDDGLKLYAPHAGSQKDPGWISCEERLATEQDEDCFDRIMAFTESGAFELISSYTLKIYRELYTHWKPTGLRRPAPPEHKPE